MPCATSECCCCQSKTVFFQSFKLEGIFRNLLDRIFVFFHGSAQVETCLLKLVCCEDNREWEGCFFNFFICFGRPSIAKVFSHNCSFGCVRLGCIPECQEALFRDRGIKSCRDILRRSLNPGGPPRRSCESSSVSGLVVFNQKLNKCSA